MHPTIEYAGLTDIGRTREENEDAFFIDPQAGLMVVADGLGGHRAGAVASAYVVHHLPRYLAARPAAEPESIQATGQLLRQSFLMLAEQVHELGQSRAEYRGMGTTAVAGVIFDGTLLLAHLGDSRAYRLRNGTLSRLTEDHNLGNAMRANGVMRAQAGEMPEYLALSRFLGMGQPPPPDMAILPLRKRDRFLLCTDGLTNMLREEEILDVLLVEASCETACAQLVEKANQAGGHDNVTVVVADIRSAAPAASSSGGLAERDSMETARVARRVEPSSF